MVARQVGAYMLIAFTLLRWDATTLVCEGAGNGIFLPHQQRLRFGLKAPTEDCFLFCWGGGRMRSAGGSKGVC